MMIVDDLLDYCSDRGMMTVSLYNLDLDKEVYRGAGDEIPEQYLDMEVQSYDVPDGITFTINI